MGTFLFFRSIAGLPLMPLPSPYESDLPSMVPGTEAVRPLAANQSLRVNEIISELSYPSPSTQQSIPEAFDDPKMSESEKSPSSEEHLKSNK